VRSFAEQDAMKRFAVRLFALSTLVLIGWVAIGQAQRLLNQPASAEPVRRPARSFEEITAAGSDSSEGELTPVADPPALEPAEPQAAAVDDGLPAQLEYAPREVQTVAANQADDAPIAEQRAYRANPQAEDGEASADVGESDSYPVDRFNQRRVPVEGAPQETGGESDFEPVSEEANYGAEETDPLAAEARTPTRARRVPREGAYEEPQQPEPTPARTAYADEEPQLRLSGPELEEPAMLEPVADEAVQMSAPSSRYVTEEEYDRAPRRVGLTAQEETWEGTGRPGNPKHEGPQSPALSVRKVLPKEVQVNAACQCEIVVRNVGDTVAESVEIVDEIPQGTRLVSTNPRAALSPEGQLVWSAGNLNPGEEVTVAVELMPIEEGEIGSQAIVRCATRTSGRTVATRPQLVLEVAAPPQVQAGEEVTVNLKITNTGSGAAKNVLLECNLPEGLTHPAGASIEYEVGQLAPGQSHPLDLVLSAATAGSVVCTMSALGQGDLRADTEVELEIVAPALAVALNGPKRRFLERQATYTVSISNPGTATAREVELVTYLPAGLKFVDANNHGQYDPKTRAVRWSLEELPARQAGEVTLVAIPIEAGEHVLRTEGKAQAGLQAQDEQVMLVEGVSDISFEVHDVEDPIERGGETTYEIKVSNQGTKEATNIRIVATMPEAMEPVDAEGPARHAIEGPRVLFDTLPRLAPKSDTTYRVRVRCHEAGDMRLRVQLLSDDVTAPVTKEEGTHVYTDE
jgi:uncharacterized repeat protein (TIGR01451 family)